ncbi:hypothetical protein [Thalassospira povalilytica]|uniref:hypothetical protein n=1 Tax=Thalassospira povalilytica TaxID=732237 RepID=UPI001D17F200|nr:hypothetical protein [Thalassospira povalilytica]MCC4239868.1 hypothetical protein [Thalassospira povalilytica]
MTNTYETSFKNHPFRFLTIPGHVGETFIPQEDLITAFTAAMPRLPREIHKKIIEDGSRETIEGSHKQRALVDGKITPVLNLMAVITIVQGLNGAMRDDKRFRKAAKGFRDFEVFFAENIGKAQRSLGTVPLWEKIFSDPAMIG